MRSSRIALESGVLGTVLCVALQCLPGTVRAAAVDAFLQSDFKEIHIIDPVSTDKVKKDVFVEIVERYHYSKSEVIVVGDDLNSEIKAAKELSIDAVLYDKLEAYKDEKSVIKITDFADLLSYL